MTEPGRKTDLAWSGLIGGALLYELVFADEPLSNATQRYCNAHPVWVRALILAVGLHLACVLPAPLDVFHADNLIHRGIVAQAARISGRT